MIKQEIELLNAAWKRRNDLNLWHNTQALRVFHGPGEAGSHPLLCQWSVDSFDGHFWFTHWAQAKGTIPSSQILKTEWIEFYKNTLNSRSGVALLRPKKDLPEEPTVLWGTPPKGDQPHWVIEQGLKFAIRTEGHRHPGLFLDHAELRQFLTQHCRGQKVLNGFAYTGSLSVAAGVSGAREVVTIDLSKPTIEWAKENWIKNNLSMDQARWIAGDVFEWLARLEKKERESFEVLILDPPSFSRGNKGTFSTQKDLTRLHELAMPLVKVGGKLITSINSANISVSDYMRDINAAAKSLKQSYCCMMQLQQPLSFPSLLDSGSRYLKGFVLERLI